MNETKFWMQHATQWPIDALNLPFSLQKHQQIVSAGKSFFTGRLCGKKNVICCNDKPESKNFFDYPTTEQLKNSCTETEPAQKVQQ